MSAGQSVDQPTERSTRIRRGELADAGELHAVGIEVTAATYGPINEEYAARTVRSEWSIEALRTSLDRYPYWVAIEETGAILGVANLGEFDGTYVMGKLYVRPKAHGRGIGTQLLESVMTAVEGRELWLEYVDGNASAAAFCSTHGFAEVRRTSPAQEGLPEMVHARRIL